MPVDGGAIETIASITGDSPQSSRRRVVRVHEEPEEVEKAPMNWKTIFSESPGALATASGRCNLPPSELSALIDKDVPLEKLANLASMFNGRETLPRS